MGRAPYKSAKALFQAFPHLTTKERPHHVYSNLTPDNTLTNNNVQQCHVEVKSDGTQYSEWQDVTMTME